MDDCVQQGNIIMAGHESEDNGRKQDKDRCIQEGCWASYARQ